MYPFIDIFGTQIHMTGVWIIVFVLTFLRWTKKYATNHGLDRWLFWKNIPLYLIVIYFLSQYLRYLIGDFVIFPLSRNQLLAYISPADYTFHMVWLVIWCAFAVMHFLPQVEDKERQIARIDTRFLSFMLACIPLWVFLLLWDNFIWNPSDTSLGIAAFHPESRVAAYDTVLPLGIYLSLLALSMFLVTKILRVKKPNLTGYWFAGWVIFLVLFCLLILFQEYTRHLVVWFVKTRDIKNYTLLLAAWHIWRTYKKNYSSISKVT